MTWIPETNNPKRRKNKDSLDFTKIKIIHS